MAGLLSKYKEQELLRIIPELQCYQCKNVPGPGNKKNRYSCINSSHNLCEDHKTKCPCGSKVGKVPSSAIAKFIENLPWMCQNYKTGCREGKMNVEDLEYHQEKCIYREVFCPFIECKKENKKILFKDVNDHLRVCLGTLGRGVYQGLKSVETNNYHIFLTIADDPTNPRQVHLHS